MHAVVQVSTCIWACLPAQKMAVSRQHVAHMFWLDLPLLTSPVLVLSGPEAVWYS